MNTPTLAGTRSWMDQGLRRNVLRSLTEMAWGSPLTDHVLGPSLNPADPELVSLQDNEAKIDLFIVAVDYILDRREKVMRHTGRTLLCWLRSTCMECHWGSESYGRQCTHQGTPTKRLVTKQMNVKLGNDQ